MRRKIMRLMCAAALLMAATSAEAQTLRLTAVLSGASETPAPGVLTGSTGTAEVYVNLAARTVTYEIRVFNMPSGTTAGHFHVGGVGLPGPIVVDLAPPVNASNDYTLTGSAVPSALRPRAEQGVRDWDDFLQSLVGGQIYVNIYSAVNPAGEIRGQLTVVP